MRIYNSDNPFREQPHTSIKSNEDFYRRLQEYYDYCYLESMHWLFLGPSSAHTIVTGMSYAVNGVDCRYFSHGGLNFAVHSQDLFYDINHILYAIKHDKDRKIQNVIFTLGYYSFFYDLSLTGTKRKCLDVYWPLFYNMHHLDVTKEMKRKVETAVKQPEFVEYYHGFFEHEPSFYGSIMTYEQTVPEISQAGGWSRLNSEQKKEEALFLASHHNKHIKHMDTFSENISLFSKALKILEMTGIRIYVMIMPFSPEYLYHIDKNYKKIILEVINNCEKTIHYIDFNEWDLFSEGEFLNSDHLNADGAKKLSVIIDGLLNE